MGNLIVGVNDLATVKPELVSEWHPIKNGSLTPSDVSFGTNKKVWWLGKCGHEWSASVSTRSRGFGCPFCAGKRIIPGVNDLATVNPEIAAEWHPIKNESLLPQNVFPHSNKKVWWLCPKCGREWQAPISTRTRGIGCHSCAAKSVANRRVEKVLANNGSLGALYPELITEWHPTKNGDLTPFSVTPASALKVWWLCSKCGHEWKAAVAARKNGRRCPRCVGIVITPGVNDLATFRPDLALEWHPTKNGDLLPTNVSRSSGRHAWWICSKCGYEWQAIINSRYYGSGCPMCARRRRSKKN